jgi:hypothetical protein
LIFHPGWGLVILLELRVGDCSFRERETDVPSDLPGKVHVLLPDYTPPSVIGAEITFIEEIFKVADSTFSEDFKGFCGESKTSVDSLSYLRDELVERSFGDDGLDSLLVPLPVHDGPSPRSVQSPLGGSEHWSSLLLLLEGCLS